MKPKKCVCLILLLLLIVQLFACAEAPIRSENNPTVDLMANIVPVRRSISDISDRHAAAFSDFSVNLLQAVYDNTNCILSPYSLYSALSMSANGADGETLRQMENVLGMSSAELNVYLYALAQNRGSELKCSNSVWFRQADDFAPNEDFLQLNADFYGADVFGAAFDENTLQDINTWVRSNTDGKIEKALDAIDPNTMMFMVNALTFDAEWASPYEGSHITPETFHAIGGDEATMMMTNDEPFYLDDGEATGFMKPYKNDRYSFVALLPNGELGAYIASLSGEKLLNTVKNASCETVRATVPKFELEYSGLLNDPLSAMGMADAFTAEANLSRMSNADLFISKVLHKTYFKVDERGTQAGAASIVSADYKGIAHARKTVVLDRPFLMGIFDNVNECFLFLGAVNSLRD